MLNEIVELGQELLNTHPNAKSIKDYLNTRISNQAQKDFQMGYFPNPDNFKLITNTLKEDDLIKSGLFYYKIFDGDKSLGSSMENHNLIMPYKDAYGRIIGLVGRSILSDTERKLTKISKYKNTSFIKANHLFGLYKAKEAIIKENCVFVVEGQFDCITAISNGIENCVCLGSGSMTFNQFSLLTRYTDNIVMLLDNDEAGNLGMNRAISNFGGKANIRKACLPDGYKDLDQFISSDSDAAREFLKYNI